MLSFEFSRRQRLTEIMKKYSALTLIMAWRFGARNLPMHKQQGCERSSQIFEEGFEATKQRLDKAVDAFRKGAAGPQATPISSRPATPRNGIYTKQFPKRLRTLAKR